MGNAEGSSDYTPMQVLRKRAAAAHARGDRYVASVRDKVFKFTTNFDTFAGEVAYGLRHTMVYRTDGGRFARALVRASGDLKIIHNAYVAANTPEGTDIRLEMYLVRRRDPNPTKRWLMSIRFRAPDWVEDNDPIVVVPDKTRLAHARCVLLDKLLGVLSIESPFVMGNEGIWLDKVLAIAERLDCPKNLDLWYYNRGPLVHYVSWRTFDDDRKRMTAKTNGQFPFDGNNYLYGEWRIFPFRTLVRNFANQPLDHVGPALLQHMLFHIDQIAQSLVDVNRELARSGPIRSLMGKIPFAHGTEKMYGLAVPFLEHLQQLQADRNHLYHAFM